MSYEGVSMGVAAKNLSRILDLCKGGALPPGAAMIELGAQNVYCSGMESFLREFVDYFRSQRERGWRAQELSRGEIAKIADRGFMSRLMRACGFDYKALDIFDADDVILFDLNLHLHQLPTELPGRFDLVTNFGTTEHVINQLHALEIMDELAKPGGIIYHDLPLGGYHMHGYFSYNPPVFQDLALANGYEILFHWYSRNSFETQAPEFMVRNGFTAKGYIDCGIEFIFRKTSPAPFRLPLETFTSLGLNPATWAGSDPYGRLGNAPSPDVNGAAAARAHPIQGGGPPMLERVSGRELQRELLRRYRRRLVRLFRPSDSRDARPSCSPQPLGVHSVIATR